MLGEPRHRVEKALPEGRAFSATLTGLEPATSAVTGRHANQLRYRALLVVKTFTITVTPTGFEPVLSP